MYSNLKYRGSVLYEGWPHPVKKKISSASFPFHELRVPCGSDSFWNREMSSSGLPVSLFAYLYAISKVWVMTDLAVPTLPRAGQTPAVHFAISQCTPWLLVLQRQNRLVSSSCFSHFSYRILNLQRAIIDTDTVTCLTKNKFPFSKENKVANTLREQHVEPERGPGQACPASPPLSTC